MKTDIINTLRKEVSNYRLYKTIKLNFKYHFGLKRKLKRQLTSIDNILQNQDFAPKIFIPLIETSHYQFYQVLGLAKSLEQRGAKIKVLICDSFLPGCEIKSVRSLNFSPCTTCRFNRNKIIKFFNLDVLYLSELVPEKSFDQMKQLSELNSEKLIKNYLYEGVDIAPSVRDSVVRYFYGALPEEGSPEIQKVREEHLLTAMISVFVAKTVEAQWSPNIVLNNMNVYSAWEPCFKFFESKGVTTNLISISQFNYNAITVNSLDLFKSNERFKRWLKKRAIQVLSEEEEGELDLFLNDRVSGNSEIFRKNAFFDEKKSILEHFDIDKNKRNVFLFSNIYWDVGMSDFGDLYDGVVSWVLDTIEAIKHDHSCHLYIKPHPGEVYDGTSSLKGLRDFINEKFDVLPNNVTIIHPEWKVNTYDLFQYIDLGIVYNGTVGLEMLLNEIPVVTTGLCPYRFLESCTTPKSIQEYWRILNGKHECIIPRLDEVRLFFLFLFY